ncbi:hypothetical protein DEJ48_02445 [Streptomyces venezuelae]|uniref:Uncharacterized protein n=1 Tax=Streptomyces venezuelae TaxID=54571 RepID=A0A5P2BPK7_STRVZ|nr:hypothetical protein [Streptomyces venezuelae]QES32415.1 hypothetical protein DEJ48_02445 [Streptomyces venezuelae]
MRPPLLPGQSAARPRAHGVRGPARRDGDATDRRWRLLLAVPQVLSAVADAAATAPAVREAGRPGDAVVYLPRHHRMWVLPTPGTVAGLRDIALDSGPDASHTLYGVEASARVIRDRMAAEPRIVFVTDPSGGAAGSDDREAAKLSVIRSHFEKCRTVPNRGPRVTLYARRGQCG